MRLHLVLLLAAAFACKGSGSNGSKDKPEAEAGPKIEGKEVEYTAGETKLKGYIAWDASKAGKRPGVLVVHEWWGHDEHARKRARMLAEMGYVGFAVDMYGEGKHADHPDTAKQFMMEVVSNMQVGVARFEAARAFLATNEHADAEKTGAIGYCFGGAVVLGMARAGAPLRGVASFHGNLSTEKAAEPGKVRAAILVAHGADDPMIPPEQVAAFQAEMKAAGANLKFIAYEGAKHSFTNPAADDLGKQFSMPIAYNQKADEASWRELETFLAGVFAN